MPASFIEAIVLLHRVRARSVDQLGTSDRQEITDPQLQIDAALTAAHQDLREIVSGRIQVNVEGAILRGGDSSNGFSLPDYRRSKYKM